MSSIRDFFKFECLNCGSSDLEFYYEQGGKMGEHTFVDSEIEITCKCGQYYDLSSEFGRNGK